MGRAARAVWVQDKDLYSQILGIREPWRWTGLDLKQGEVHVEFAAIIADAAIVPVGTPGAINAFATNDTDLIIDINGYFVAPTPSTLQFYPLPPCRVQDTRSPTGTFGGPSLARGAGRSFPISASSCALTA